MWCIERLIANETRYLTDIFDEKSATGNKFDFGEFDEALKFADAGSASKVLFHALGAMGKIAEHAYISADKPA